MFLNSSMMITTFLLLLILPQVSGNIYGPRQLISHVGGLVTIKCYYLTTTANKHDRKYWCKESERSRNCQTLISTTGFIHENYKTRVSMEDINQNGILLVTMRQLEKNDSGRYRCGIGKSNNIGLYYGMDLNISEGRNLPKSPEIFLGKVSGSVAIKCSSESHKLSDRRFLCKLGRTGCSLIADPNRNTSRFVFTAEDSSGNFQVFINRLRKEDSGMYKCGTGTPESMRAKQLLVTEESVFSNILSYAQPTYEPQTSLASSQSYVTNEFYKDSSSQAKPNLLLIVMPVLLVALVLAVIVIAVFVKVKQRKKYDPRDVDARNPEVVMELIEQKCKGEHPKEENRGPGEQVYAVGPTKDPSDVDARNPEVAIPLTEQKCPGEHPKEENRGSDEEGSAVGPYEEIPATSVYCLLGKPDFEESREKD